ncbi:MAG TPA: alpha-hydroxy acid oxidase [Gemmatimonadaceae bacterium]|nr:alpha-hydroxy acid oxidase [Gemmatimonadaceae bacterium]
MDDHKTLLNLREFEAAAESRLPRMVFDYYAGGAGDEVTARTAHDAWDAVSIRYRVLRDVSKRTLGVSILGDELGFPVLAAPMAFQRLAHPDGELATARAAAGAGAGMVLSTLATTSIEDVRAGASMPLWFQLYIYRDRGASRALVERAASAGCTALVLTVDSPLLGRRERDARNGFHVSSDFTVPNLTGDPRAALAAAAAHGGDGSALAKFVESHWDSSISWRDVEWLRSVTQLPILIKGIVRGDDAALAMEHGASGVIVSNHGGRQLDTSLATARALPEVADAMAGRGTLLVDGGIRRGTDIIKALALGANAVLLGRPVLWGLALGGEHGVRRVFDLLRDEYDLALALTGCRSSGELSRDFVA